MIKGIKIAADKRIEIITKLFFPPLSDSELRLLKTLISFSTGNSVTLTADVSKQILLAADIGQSLFNTSLHRLEKKGILNSAGKTKNLHPIYNNIGDWEKVLISFV